MTRDGIAADEILSRTHAIGQYYGFVPLTSLTTRERGSVKAKPEENKRGSMSGLTLDPTAETIAQFLRQLQRSGAHPSARQPLFAWHTNITPGRPAPKRAIVQFHALGTDRVLADAVVIRAALALVRDLYRTEPVVRINSMGDKETRARYTRELGLFFKKRGDSLPPECIACAKRDAMEAAELAIARLCADDLPAPTEHLSDSSRKRFEDLLEILENTETPYELARDLISRGSAWSETCFEVLVNGQRVAWGSRYSDLARQLLPQSGHGTGAVLQLVATGAVKRKVSLPKPRVSFVHIGDEAKRLSITLADHFRKARAPLTQDIGIESLTEQLSLAERRGSPYVLIMGRKEALEGSAILRELATQQETILPLATLPEQLRHYA